MSTVKFIVPGEYWDSQIYQGRLYLFARDGTLRTINWDHLIDGIGVPERLRLALECAFRRSDYLYGEEWELFFSDPEIKSIIVEKFDALAEKAIQPSKKLLKSSEIKEQDSPFPFPHADSVIYNKNMYVVGESGLWRSTCSRRGHGTNPVSSRPERKWDCPTTSVAAAYGALALATGKEGLWEFDLKNLRYSLSDDEGDPAQLSKRDCDACEWMYFSVYGTSYVKGGFLAEYKKSDDHAGDYLEREFSKIVSSDQIFDETGYSWGTRDKIYLVRGSQVLVARYNPYADEGTIGDIHQISIAGWKGEFVSGGVGTFGAIFEYDNAIVVMPSEGDNVTLAGEPINWRVFPGSRYYQNHLHVIYDDRLEIHSFNQDYFVKQADKLFGSRAITNQARMPRRQL